MAGTFADRAPDAYDDIVVVGGGCYGSYYVRQLGRAAAAHAISWKRLTVVDRDPECRVAHEPRESATAPETAPAIVVAEWEAFFDAWLARPRAGRRDAIVPSPLMPHLFYEYVARRVRARWPGRAVARVAAGAAAGTPWERVAPDHTIYVSHATWMCPVNCVEPRICPHTRGVRDWTMPASLESWVHARRAAGEQLLGPFTFHCTHRAYGVGMVDALPIQEAERAIVEAAARGSVRALIATASHCHGAAAVLSIA